MTRGRAARVPGTLALVLLLLVGLAGAPARATTSLAAVRPVVEDTIASQLAARPLAGLAVAVGFGDEEWRAGYGYADVEQKIPMTATTELRVASVTKTMTAAGIMMLVEEGKLDLDEEVRGSVRAFPRKPWPVTVRQVLGHLGGVASYKNCAVECHDKAPKTTAQALAVFSSWPLEAKPGDRYVYTTYGYNLLGAVIEKKSGLSYDVFLRKKLGPRAGLVATRLDRGPRGKNRAKGYRVKDGALAPSERIDVTGRFAGGGAVSTAEDLLRFGRALVDGRVVSKASLAAMSRSMATSDGRLTKYGMGMATYTLAGRRVIGHAGGQPETSSLLLMYPGHGLVVALVTNTEDQWGALYAVAGRIAELVLNDGERRRGVAARDLADARFVDVLAHAYDAGLADFEAGEASLDDAAMIRAAGDAVVALLDEANGPDDALAHTDRVERALGPAAGAPLAVVGALAARRIATALGPDAVERAHREGPLAFFRRAAELPPARPDEPNALLPAPVVARLRALDEAHARAAAISRDVLVDATTTVDALTALLDGTAAQAARPDLADEILDEADRARAATDDARAVALEDLAARHFPHHAKAALTIAERHLGAGALDEGRKALAAFAGLPGARDRLFPERATARARALAKTAGGRAAAVLLLECAHALWPRREDVLDEASAQRAAMGDLDAAIDALTRASALAPSRVRAKKLRALETKRAANAAPAPAPAPP